MIILLGANSGVQLEQVQSRIEVGLTDNQKRVTDRTWLQLMCCTHSYDMWVCPIILGWLSKTGVGQRSDRGRIEFQSQRISQV